MQLMRWKWLYLAISTVALAVSLTGLLLNGLQLSVDFLGGSLIELRLPAETELPTTEKMQEIVGDAWQLTGVQQSGESQLLLRGETLSQEQQAQVLQNVTQGFGKAELLRAESVGAVISRELLTKTVTALGLVTVFILFYIWRQFSELRFGVAAVIAMLHDSVILLGTFSWLGYFLGVEVDVLFVTALLTTLSFSVHDTIVVFDRIRELRRKHSGIPFTEVINAAVLETLGRSINNSITIIVMLAALSLLGGETIRWFAVALLIGAITGTYSSTFTAVPIITVWEELGSKVQLPRFLQLTRKRK